MAEDSSFLKKCSHYLPKTHSKSTVNNLQLQLPYRNSQKKEVDLYKTPLISRNLESGEIIQILPVMKLLKLVESGCF